MSTTILPRAHARSHRASASAPRAAFLRREVERLHRKANRLSANPGTRDTAASERAIYAWLLAKQRLEAYLQATS